eukprot:jgi/Chrpa1/25501/Chrysochromulina_OHIO_Genome00025740-RA
MYYRCENTCTVPSSYANCDDGGPDSFRSWCDLGTDCDSCGPRMMRISPPPSPPPLPPILAPPLAPAIGPEIVVEGDNAPQDCRWALTCRLGYEIGYSYPNGVMPQRVRPPPLAPGSTCTLTLKAYWGYGWSSGSWAYGDRIFTNPYDPSQSGERVDTIYTFTLQLASPPPKQPPPPNLPPIAPIAANTGFPMVVPQLIITYSFNGLLGALRAALQYPAPRLGIHEIQPKS